MRLFNFQHKDMGLEDKRAHHPRVIVNSDIRAQSVVRRI